MFKNKIVFVIAISFFLTSCGGWDSVKRGITGAKQKTGDEFLVKKKDPLVLPPNYDNLPTPDERTEAQEEASSIEQSLTIFAYALIFIAVGFVNIDECL